MKLSQAVAFVCFPIVALAGPTLTHQGRLVDGSGRPIEGTHQLAVSPWNDPSAALPANLRHDETFTVALSDGYYSVLLGADALDPIGAGDLVGDVWVEIAVDPPASPLGPRQRLADAPDAQELRQTLFAFFQQFTGDATWTVPPGVTRVYVEISGGGGGGGGLFGTFQASGGGQGGWGEVRAGFLEVFPGGTLTLIVGAGGTAGAANGGTGGNGGTTGVLGGTTTISAGGGGGAGVGNGGTGTSGPGGGTRLEYRNGQNGSSWASAGLSGFSTVSGAACTYSRGEGGCGGRAILNAGDPGVLGSSGYVRLWY